MRSQTRPDNPPKPSFLSSGSCYVFFFFVLPVSFALIVYHLDPSDPVSLPDHHHQQQAAPKPAVVDGRILRRLGLVGSGQVVGPEDLVYDPVSRAMYTGTADGWIKRIVVGDGSGSEKSTPAVEVEAVVNTGGRPLGLALSRRDDAFELIIADAYKGLLKLTKDQELVLLTKEAEGTEFKLTDGVDVAKDGTIYFTDASSKHTLHEFAMDHLEGRPNGRLLSFDPITRHTKVLLRDLYFPNGLLISHDQSCLIFCETMLRTCSRYHIAGPRAGSVEPFVNGTFGAYDNIHSDGEDLYWIGVPMSLPPFLYKVMNYRLVRKVLIIVEKYIGLQSLQKFGGVLAVDMEGNPLAYFYDQRLSMITSAIKIGQQLYWGSLNYPHIFSLNLSQYPL